MRPNTAIRYALFLIVLVLGQEFCVGYHTKLLQDAHQNIEKTETDKGSLLQAKSRQKRAYGVILLVVTLTTSMAGVGFELYNKIRGCCGLYPKACDYAREAEAIEKRWPAKTRAVDAIFLRAKNLYENIIQIGHYKTVEMWNDLLDISRYEQTIVKLLSPNGVDKFHKKWAAIEQQLKNGNKTVQGWSYAQIDLTFRSYFDGPKTALGGLSGFLSNGLSAVYTVSKYYYKVNQLNKMINVLSTGKSYRQLTNAKTSKVLGVNDVGIKNFVKDTAKARMRAKAGTAKYAWLTHSYNVVSTAMSLGFEIYHAYTTIKTCEKKRDDVQRLLDNWRRADTGMKQIKTNAINYYNSLRDLAWKNTQGNLTSANLHKTLGDIKTIAAKASPKTAELRNAVTYIGNFISQINGSISNPAKIYQLQLNLIKGLVTVKFLLKCYTFRVRFVDYVSYSCQNGFLTLAEIYAQGKPLFAVTGGNCLNDVGVRRIQLSDMEFMIASKAAKEGYQKDCILNNVDKKKSVCRDQGNGYAAPAIAARIGLTLNQVKYFTSKCSKQLTSSQKARVCGFRSFGAPNSAIQQKVFSNFPLSVIKAVKCP